LTSKGLVPTDLGYRLAPHSGASSRLGRRPCRQLSASPLGSTIAVSSCICASLPAEFERDPDVEFLGGEIETLASSDSLRLVSCRTCGQLWRVDLPPELAPRAHKLDSTEGWTHPPGEPPRTTASESTPAILPVLSTVSEAIALCWSNLHALLILAALPWAGAVLLGAVYRFIQSRLPKGESELAWLAYGLVLIAGVLPFAFFAFAWHRRILLNHPASSAIRSHAWTSRHAPFLAWSLLIALVYPALVGLSFLAPDRLTITLLLVGSSIPLAYVAARLSVALPSTAVGGPVGPRAAWLVSRGAGIALLLVVVLAGFSAWVVLLPLTFVLKTIGSLGNPAAAWLPLLSEARDFGIAAMEIAALSLSYRRLTEARAA